MNGCRTEVTNENTHQAVTSFYNDINPATLSGAIDIVVVRDADGNLSCSPFHVRFGKLVLLRPTEKKVVLSVNGTPFDIPMKVGEAGEAFFVVEMDKDDPAPSEYATSPIIRASSAFLEANSFDLGHDARVPSEALNDLENIVIDNGDKNSLTGPVGLPPQPQLLQSHIQNNLDVIPNQMAVNRRSSLNEDENSSNNHSLLLNGKPLVEGVHKLDISNSTVPGAIFDSAESNQPQSLLPVGSPGWQWKWGGLPTKKEEQNVDIDTDADADASILGTSVAVAGTIVGLSTNAEAKEVNNGEIIEQRDNSLFSLTQKVPLPKIGKPPIGSSFLTAALLSGDSSHGNSRIRESVDESSVTVDEKVGTYLNSLDREPMTSPDRPPSIRARSPSPVREQIGSIAPILNFVGADQTFVKILNSDGTVLPPIELSLCGKVAIAATLYQSPQTATAVPASATHATADTIFNRHLVTFESFSTNAAAILTDTAALVVRINGAYYDWTVVAPVLVSAAAFGRLLPEEAIRKLIDTSVLNDKALIAGAAAPLPVVKTLPQKPQTSSFSNLRSWWSRSPAPSQTGQQQQQQELSVPKILSPVPTSAILAVKDVNDDAIIPSSPVVAASEIIANAAADTQSIDDERSKRYIKSLRMTSDQLKGLNLNPGVNTISFTVTSRLQGTATCTSKIFLWEHDTKVVISDVDGTITKSDVLGHVFTMVGQDWTHSGVASLYTNIHNNGYQILYLTSRAIGQANYTRDYLKKVEQGKFQLPEGPIVMSPDRLFAAFHRQVLIQRRPEEFKISCLRDIKRLFGPSAHPFVAGFGNRITDVQSYRAVDIPLSRIFTIDPSGEIKLEFTSNYKSSYAKLNEIVDGIFPKPPGLLLLSSTVANNQSTEVFEKEHFEDNFVNERLQDKIQEDEWAVWKKYLPEAVIDMTAEAKIESGVQVADTLGGLETMEQEVLMGGDAVDNGAVVVVIDPDTVANSDRVSVAGTGESVVFVQKASKIGEITVNESGAAEVGIESADESEYEEYEEEEGDEGEEEVGEEDEEILKAGEDDETVRARMTDLKNFKY
ncbi:Phosphatidate phosphatase lpin1 [Physocladia obscura]|uniref:phosphatidate phosphatase n=1 Tax=Physocladia obscura TaxID=109957 RepID=A0AAD5TAL9_9FUNG|nr:Phosphatidate phosphatase lpin1 [Physocladia obscura]